MDTRLRNALTLAHELTADKDVTHQDLLLLAYAILKAFDGLKKQNVRLRQ
jgi:hypothetical protein